MKEVSDDLGEKSEPEIEVNCSYKNKSLQRREEKGEECSNLTFITILLAFLSE
jgi:hypothetical protein